MSLVALLCGCAAWSKQKEGESPLKPPKMSPDSVVLEIAFVRIPTSEAETVNSIWDRVDELRAPVDLRGRLQANGLRCGVFGARLPYELQRLIDESVASAPAAILDHGFAPNQFTMQQFTPEQMTQNNTSVQRLQMRAGRRGEIVANGKQDSRVILWTEPDGVFGSTFPASQCLFSVKAWPQADGSVFVKLTPELKYGETRQRYVGNEGRLLWKASQETKVFDDLRFDARLSPGETLVLAAAPPAKGLGRHFFLIEKNGAPQQKILLVRLAGTQHDGVFSADQVLAPIVSSTE